MCGYAILRRQTALVWGGQKKWHICVGLLTNCTEQGQSLDGAMLVLVPMARDRLPRVTLGSSLGVAERLGDMRLSVRAKPQVGSASSVQLSGPGAELQLGRLGCGHFGDVETCGACGRASMLSAVACQVEASLSLPPLLDGRGCRVAGAGS